MHVTKIKTNGYIKQMHLVTLAIIASEGYIEFVPKAFIFQF